LPLQENALSKFEKFFFHFEKFVYFFPLSEFLNFLGEFFFSKISRPSKKFLNNFSKISSSEFSFYPLRVGPSKIHFQLTHYQQFF